jgi:multisubunit Na+/H+ antiporter MnhE subunit
MDFSIGNLIAGFLFGLIGLYLFRAAKREANLICLTLSLVLMIYPYFVSNEWATWGIGIVVTVFAYRSL